MSKNPLPVTLLALLAAVTAAHAQAPSAGMLPGAAAPRLVCPNPVWDFGPQPQFKRLEHTFVLRNEGDSLLRIQSIQPSCQCQAAMPAKRELSPGEQTSVKATFDTKNFSGPIHKPITVKTNDPSRPTMQLLVRGKVLPPYWLAPVELNMGRIAKAGAPEPQEFSIFLSPKADVEITSIETTSPYLTWQRLTKNPETRPDGSRALRFRVQLKPGLPVGIVRERLIVNTDVPQKRSAALGVNAEVAGEIKLTPRTFRLGRLKRGQAGTRSVEITKSGTSDLVIESVKLKGKDVEKVFRSELIEVEKGRHYRVKVSVLPDAPRGYHRGRVVIMTNCKGERVHQAYFYVSIRG